MSRNLDELRANLETLVQAGLDLANSVSSDLKVNRGQVSIETTLFMDDFRKKHEGLETILDVLNGLQ